MTHGYQGLLAYIPPNVSEEVDYTLHDRDYAKYDDFFKHVSIEYYDKLSGLICIYLDVSPYEWRRYIIEEYAFRFLLDILPLSDSTVKVWAYTILLMYSRTEGNRITLDYCRETFTPRTMPREEDLARAWDSQKAYRFSEESDPVPVGNWLDNSVYWLYLATRDRELLAKKKNEEERIKKLS